MTRKDVIIIYAVYQRKTSGITSFLTIPIELRKSWVNHSLVTGMARYAKELRGLRHWEFICYYHDEITE